MVSSPNRPSQDQRARSVTRRKADEIPEQQVPEISDQPILEHAADDAVRKMVNLAKERGYITQELLNSEGVTSEQIEDILATLNEIGINVVESENPKLKRTRTRSRNPRRRSPALSS